MKRFATLSQVMLLLWGDAALAHDENLPTELHFQRQASQRLIFDREQALPLASLDPTKIVDLELMHPVRTSGGGKAEVKQGNLILRGPTSFKSSIWLSGFNPFATYRIELSTVGDGQLGLEFRQHQGSSLRIEMVTTPGRIDGVHWSLRNDQDQVQSEGTARDFQARPVEGPVTFLVQMTAIGFNLYCEQQGTLEWLGRADIVAHLDVRKKEVFRNMSTWIHAEGSRESSYTILGASAELSPGIGQADIRTITDEEGTPLMDEGRLWFTATTRGGGLPHPAQGVFSLSPGLFDFRFEGLIAFDRGDGLLRNDLASHLFFDRKNQEWRGWTTAFSAFGDPQKKEPKEILAVRSLHDPRHGFSTMQAAPIGLVGDYEDPQGVFDSSSGTWRMLLCQNAGGYKAAVFESDHWDGGFHRIAGPVASDSTGTTLQTLDGTRYAFFGSADQSFHVCTFPELQPLGKLDLDLPPWRAKGPSRVWPCIVPLPEGYPAPYLLLTFDRANFPGMPLPNWTYGALHLYHGHFPGK
ncbi:hypothetical protein HNR46_004140 [Haloferula luteola]|uniref:Uncharacterized protein n=1 Tax=Haloferula luteola TaxID=595692 RepID=A0A840V9W7_9BACT|nr:hypothetical protein [Haloferula luteola]MBB5353876.1 hypothetical protein [Haloferula luteola]